jgi:hypothetical protein
MYVVTIFGPRIAQNRLLVIHQPDDHLVHVRGQVIIQFNSKSLIVEGVGIFMEYRHDLSS